MGNDSIRVGCYSAFWGDSIQAAQQLVYMDNPPDYIVADYLAEVTMGILARARNKTSQGQGADSTGYVKEFVDYVWKRLGKDIIAKNIKIITNAGGLDPVACKRAIEEAAKGAGMSHIPIVAAVYGDDLLGEPEAMKNMVRDGPARPFVHITDGERNKGEEEAWPKNKKIVSANTYMGAIPIAKALADGAQIIVTGRCVDSALVLGPLLHEFAWSPTSYDLLASGSLAGHIIECGCQATGGNFTDWELSAHSANGGWSNMGYPIVQVYRDGSFDVTKPPGTGGIVSVASVGEQMVYEVLDPGAYMLPDVTLDMRQVTLSQVGADCVHVAGAKGRAPSPYLKVSGVYQDGYKLSAELVLGGIDAKRKAEAVANAILARVRRTLKALGQPDFSGTNVECLGAEHTYGPHSVVKHTREVLLRITVVHESPVGLMMFGREVAPAATCMAPGITGAGSGRPRPSPNLTHFSCLVPKSACPGLIVVGHGAPTVVTYDAPISESSHVAPVLGLPSLASPPASRMVTVPLIRLCYGRSGDKGDTCNIGLLARDPKYYPYLVQILTPEKVFSYMSHLVHGRVRRYELPGCFGLNFVLTRALGGGGLSSLRIDRQGKTYAQMLLCMEVDVPVEWAVHAHLERSGMRARI
ncbi:hypothetical protein SpCBS45565_g08387 [Spizellomyces sp. 'palustris']|nr:hypothetical protein SpCBS45565_g08387 [Spizellomyces sp. 'palustris']